MKVLVTGSRRWVDREVIRKELSLLPEGTLIVHGAEENGADTIADEEAKKLGFETDPNPADWLRFHRAAGPIRNTAMLKKHPDIDLVLAFHDDLWNGSKGTKDMVKKALEKHLHIRLINSRGEYVNDWRLGGGER